ncbi:hypothetical protein [Cognatishimia sp. F0-27]|uniref:hypothetical protein n=1 Tax=Cognatishimia sp. F0-27 TaxID=2816855 RepID=UPI001D0C6BA4|nr:hypothetical protein [Cognatishimia sp. F0-27]MCC1491559.1 hypothetical protein [Cognatishimia sp. F0-27]
MATKAQQATKTVFVHVGFPKTGTSTFQAMLRHNAGRLAASGLAVVTDSPELVDFSKQAGRIGNPRRNALATRLHLRRSARSLADSVARLREPRVLISHENLPGWRVKNLYNTPFHKGPVKAISAVESAFGECRLTWMLMTREAAAHQRSAYKFFSRRKGTAERFEDWVAAMGPAENLDRMVEDARAYWGERLMVFRMEDEIASGDRWGHGMLRAIGVPQDVLDTLEDVPDEKVGLPPSLLPFAHRINALGLEKPLRQALVEMLPEVRDAVLEEHHRASSKDTNPPASPHAERRPQ